MTIYVDIDNTITKTCGTNYKEAIPLEHNIKIINTLYNSGHTIIYWTSRGVLSNINYYDLTKKQLDSWGCKYNELRCDKPFYDIFIDDKALSSIKLLDLE